MWIKIKKGEEEFIINSSSMISIDLLLDKDYNCWRVWLCDDAEFVFNSNEYSKQDMKDFILKLMIAMNQLESDGCYDIPCIYITEKEDYIDIEVEN